MARNLSHDLKRVVAGLCAVLIVTGSVPVKPLADIFNSAVITASAVTTIDDGDVFVCDGTTYDLRGSVSASPTIYSHVFNGVTGINSGDTSSYQSKMNGFSIKIAADGTLTMEGKSFAIDPDNQGYNAWAVKWGYYTGDDSNDGHIWIYRTTVSITPTVTAPTYKEYWNLYWPGRPVQLLNNAGSTNSPAGLQYAVSTSNTAAPTDGWTDDYTAVTGNIGTNYVWYKVDATDGYNAVEPTCMSGSATVGLNSESVILPGTVVSSDKPLRLKEFKGYRYGANATEEYLEGYGTDNTTNKTWTADVPYVLVDYPTSSSSYYEVRLRKAVLLSDLIGDNTEFPINMNNQPWETGYALINDTDINARFEDYHDYYERSDGTGSYGSSGSSYLRPYGAVGGGNGINYCVIDKIEYDYQYSGSTEKVYKVTVYYPTVLPQTVDDQKAAYNREKTVSAFELPTSEYGTWTWEDPDLDITAVGTYTPTAVFTTNDPKKYKSKTQEVTVNVVPAVDFNDSTATVWTDEDDKDGSTVTYTTIEKGDEFYSNKELTFTGATALGSEIGDGVYQYYISKVTSGVSLVTVNHSHTYAYSTADNGYQLIGTCTTEEGNVQDTIAELTVTADEPLKDGQITYTDNYTVEVGDYTISSKEFYKKSGSSYNYSGTAAPTDAGEYKVKVTVTINGANYALERPFTIERKDITAADYNAQTVTIGDYINSGDEYDGENHIAVVDTSDSRTNRDITYTTGNGVKNAGEHTITVTGTGNYTGSYTMPEKFVITKAALPAIAFDSPDIYVYDGTAKAIAIKGNSDDEDLNARVSKFLRTGDLKVRYGTNSQSADTNNAYSDAGSYYAFIEINEDNLIPVDGQVTSMSYKIDRRHVVLTIADSSKSKTYGEADPALNVTFDDSVASRENKTNDFKAAISRTAGENAGNYPYSVSNTAAANSNYTLSLAGSPKLTINKKNISDLTFTPVWEQRTYNGSEQIFEVSGSYTAATVTDDNITFDISGNKATNVKYNGVTVASYTATVTGTGNYTGTKTFGYTITPKDITDDDNITLTLAGDELNTDPAYNYVYKQGITRTPALTVRDSQLDTDLSGETDYEIDESSKVSGTDTGLYTITVNGKGNYTGARTVEWSIGKAVNPAAFASEETSKSYDGQKFSVDVNVPESNGVVYTYAAGTYDADSDGDSVNWDGTAPVNVGTYTVKAVVAESDNYFGTTIYKTFTIEQAHVTVKAQPVSVTYGDANPTVFAFDVTEGTVYGEDKLAEGNVIELADNTARNAGEYGFRLADELNANYDVTLDGSVKFIIGRKAVTVAPAEGTVTYGEDYADAANVPYTAADGDLAYEDTADFGTLFTVDYSAGDDAGNYNVVPSQEGLDAYNAADSGKNYTVSVAEGEYKLTVVPRQLEDGDVTLSSDSFTYNGETQKPEVTVKGYDGNDMAAGEKTYRVGYSNENSTDKGDYTVTVTGQGNYTGTVNKDYAIGVKSLEDDDVAVTASEVIYNGAEQTAALEFRIDGETAELAEGTDYTVTNNKKTAADTYTITVEGTGNYTGTKTVEWKISPAALAETDVTVTESNIYNGSANLPEITVKGVGGAELARDTDYTVTYKKGGEDVEEGDVKNSAAYEVVITGVNNYAGTFTKSYTIEKKVLEEGDVTIAEGKDHYTFTNTSHVVGVTDLRYADTNIIYGRDIRVIGYVDNDENFHESDSISVINAGNYKLRIAISDDPDCCYKMPEGVEYYDLPIVVDKFDITDCENDQNADGARIYSPNALTYTGQPQAFQVLVYDAENHPLDPDAGFLDITKYSVKNQGDNIVTVYGEDIGPNFKGQKDIVVSVAACTLTDADFTVSENITYDAAQVDLTDFTIAVADENNAVADEMLAKAEKTITFAEGDDGMSAGAHSATITLHDPDGNIEDVVLTENFTIAKAPVTIVPADGQTVVYGTTDGRTDFAPEYTVEGKKDNAFDGKDLLDAADAYRDARGAVNDEGYAFQPDAAFDEEDYPNYEISFADGVFQVTPVDIGSDAVTKTLAQEDGFVYTGARVYILKDGNLTLEYENVWNDPVTFEYVSGKKYDSEVGPYNTEIRGTGSYTGTYDVNWKIVENKFEDRTYDVSDITYGETLGYELPSEGSDPAEGTTVTYEFIDAQGVSSDEVPVNAGTYTVKATISHKNYVSKTFESDFEIRKKALTVALDDLSIEYGQADPETTAAVITAGVINDDDVQVTVERIAIEETTAETRPVGTYSFTAAVADITVSNDNYFIETDLTGTLEVTKITLKPEMFTVDDSYADGSKLRPVITTELAEGDDYVIDSDESEIPAVEPSIYHVVLKAADEGNYTGSVELEWNVLAKKDISEADVTLTCGENGEPVVTVRMGDDELAADTDYTYVVRNSAGEEVTDLTAPDTYTVEVTGKNAYEGENSATLEVEEEAVTPHASSYTINLYYDGQVFATVTTRMRTNIHCEAPTMSGKQFVCWRLGSEDGTVVGTQEKFNYFLTENTDLYAVFADEGENVELEPTVFTTSVNKGMNSAGDNAIVYNVSKAVPDGYTFKEYGLRYATNTKIGLSDDYTIDFSSTNRDEIIEYLKTSASKVVFNYNEEDSAYRLTMKMSVENRYFYAIPYMIVTDDETGEDIVVYGDLTATSYESAVDNDAPIAYINSVKKGTTASGDNAIVFNVQKRVPSDYEFVSYGIKYATNKKLGYLDDISTDLSNAEGYDVEDFLKNDASASVVDFGSTEGETAYDLTMKMTANDRYFYVISYVKVRDKSGQEYTIYDDSFVAVTYDTAE